MVLHAPPPGNIDLQAARAALLLLKATVPGGESVYRFRLGSSGEAEPAEATAVRLVGMGKPLRCTASVNGAALEIAMNDALPADYPPFEIQRSAPIRMALSEVPDLDAMSILMTGAGESLLLSGRVVQAWTRDYPIGVPFSMSGDYPTEEQRAHGISWVIEVGHEAVVANSPDDLSIPEPFRQAVSEEYRNMIPGRVENGPS